MLRAIPVVVLTTSGRDEDVWRSYQAGANTFIQKPAEYATTASSPPPSAATGSRPPPGPRDGPPVTEPPRPPTIEIEGWEHC